MAIHLLTRISALLLLILTATSIFQLSSNPTWNNTQLPRNSAAAKPALYGGQPLLTRQDNLFETPGAYSVDAIAVWGSNNDIFYSFYGHTPKTPKPIDAITGWSWWSAAGVGASDIIPGADNASGTRQNLAPQVAFSREGWAVAVWSTLFANGTCTSGGITSQLYESNIAYSVFNGTKWLPSAVLASPNMTNNFYNSPAVAMDSNQNGLAAWTHTQQAFDPSTCTFTGSTNEIRGKLFLGKDASEPKWRLETTIAPPIPALQDSASIAFTSTPSTAATPLTQDTAVVIWNRFDSVASFTACGSPGSTPTFWPAYSSWTGTAFSAPTPIPGKPPGPPYPITAEHRTSLSSDMSGNARAVWITQLRTPLASPPCFSDSRQIWSALWNGTAGSGFVPSTSGMFDSGVGASPGTAFLWNDTALAVYPKSASPGCGCPGPLRYSRNSGGWSSNSSISGATGGWPSIASLAHNKTIVLWVDGADIKSLALQMNTNNWDATPVTVGSGGEVAVAARTGSPSLPLAKWTFLAYYEHDNNLDVTADGRLNDIKSVGSTPLVNMILLLDRAASHSLMYLERNRVGMNRILGNLDLGDDQVLSDYVSWAAENYPAGRYFLQFGNHGSGWQGVCYDDHPEDHLDLPKLSKGLSDTHLHFSIVTFDACLMSQLEVAYQIYKFADYMVASEEVMNGLWFDRFMPNYLQYLRSNPSVDSSQVATQIVVYFKNWFGATPYGAGEATIAATNLSSIPRLAVSVDSLASYMLNNFAADKALIKNARAASEAMAFASYVDLSSFLGSLNAQTTDLTLRAKAQDTINRLGEAVILFWAKPPPAQGAHPLGSLGGLTAYFETDSSILGMVFIVRGGGKFRTAGTMDLYSKTDFAKNTMWDEFILKYANDPSHVILRLDSSVPVSLHANDTLGNHVGRGCSLGSTCAQFSCGGIDYGIPSSSYLDLGNGTVMITLPTNITQLTWTVDASLLAAGTATYTLNIAVIQDNIVIQQQTLSGTITAGQKLTGTFTQLPPSEIPPEILILTGISVGLVSASVIFVKTRRKKAGSFPQIP